MTEDAVLARLSDIHVPVDIGAAAPIAFAAWPFMTLAIIVGAICLVRIWRSNRWRRSAKAEFARIVEVKDHAAQWPMLLAFAASLPDRAGRPVTLPDLAYRRPETVSQDEKAAFISFLSAELAR